MIDSERTALDIFTLCRDHSRQGQRKHLVHGHLKRITVSSVELILLLSQINRADAVVSSTFSDMLHGVVAYSNFK